MANQDTAFGLRPIGLTGAGANTTGVTQYEIANDNTNVIYQYSPVIPLAAGEIDIVGAAAGGTVPALGVLMGVEYVDSSSKKTVWKNYWPGSGGASIDTNFPVKAFVADNPNQLFLISADATVTDRATALADVFSNCSLATGTSGSTNTGRSTAELDISTAAATATLLMRIQGLSTDISNLDYASAGVNFIVRFNFHHNAPCSNSASQTTAASTGI
mgnify:CR=1 FL=1|jgi:hypothetical protein|tara:strand:- start:178 stop:825 length:648 start_codon:yes stop_codon:yes gene_type:complete